MALDATSRSVLTEISVAFLLPFPLLEQVVHLGKKTYKQGNVLLLLPTVKLVLSSSKSSPLRMKEMLSSTGISKHRS